jgi:hypothetical protein
VCVCVEREKEVVVVCMCVGWGWGYVGGQRRCVSGVGVGRWGDVCRDKDEGGRAAALYFVIKWGSLQHNLGKKSVW